MLGDMICKLRKQKEYSQNQLGDLLNLSASTIGMYEQNRRLPDIDVLVNLCKLFAVSSDYILEISENPHPYELSITSDSIQTRISYLMDYNDTDTSLVAYTTKIRKQRLDDILTKGKKPDVNELIALAECFGEYTDYLLCLTDEHQPIKQQRFLENSFSARIKNLVCNNSTEFEVANHLDISIAKLRKLINGEEQPTPLILCQLANFFEVSTDYLLGLTNTSRKPYPHGTYPFETDNTSIERLQKALENELDEYLASILGITDDEYYEFYHYGFVIHISVLQKLCKYKNISLDYLLNLSDSKLSINVSIDSDEDELITNYRKLEKPYKRKIEGMIAEQILQQERDSYMRSSVAADEPLEKTGTDNQGK